MAAKPAYVGQTNDLRRRNNEHGRRAGRDDGAEQFHLTADPKARLFVRNSTVDVATIKCNIEAIIESSDMSSAVKASAKKWVNDTSSSKLAEAVCRTFELLEMALFQTHSGHEAHWAAYEKAVGLRPATHLPLNTRFEAGGPANRQKRVPRSKSSSTTPA